METPATAYPAGLSCAARPGAVRLPVSAIHADPPVQITTGNGPVEPAGIYRSSLCPLVPAGSAGAYSRSAWLGGGPGSAGGPPPRPAGTCAGVPCAGTTLARAAVPDRARANPAIAATVRWCSMWMRWLHHHDGIAP